MKIDLQQFKQPCSCNHEHPIEVEAIYIEEGAINQMAPFLFQKGLTAGVLLICDTNTREIATCITTAMHAGRECEQIDSNICELEAKRLHADEKGLSQIRNQIRDMDQEGELPRVLVAIGAGTIHDLTRYVAKEKGIPFISVPTAASVDGFVSTVCAMTFNGFKVTTPGVAPIAVFADTAIFSKAPKRLTASGVADLLGKYTALVDWKVSHLLIDEYLCETVVALEEKAVKEVVSKINGLANGEKEAYESLMYGLLLSGLAMQMVGNSRPASGAEHHLSHLWEMHCINPELDALHGEKVGVGLTLVCEQYKKILQIENLEKAFKNYQGFPKQVLKEAFRELYQEIEQENKIDSLQTITQEVLAQHLQEIKEIVEKLPSKQEVQTLLKQVGGKVALEEIGLSEDLLEKSLFLSPYVRNRLTLMRVSQLLEC